MTFETNAQMVDYINQKIPAAMNIDGVAKAKAYVWKSIGETICFTYIADKRGLQNIDQNNAWLVKFILHTTPDNPTNSPQKFEVIQGVGGKWGTSKHVKTPRYRKGTCFKKIADDLVNWIVKNKETLTNLDLNKD